MAQMNFDASQVKPQEAFEPLPAGWYNGQIVASELKPTKNNDGTYLQMEIQVLDGACAGRKVFDRVNLANPNPVAAEIGQRRLSAYCYATGVLMLQDSQQLHGIPFKLRVSVRTDSTGQYDPSNDVKAVKHISEAVPGAAAAPSFAPPAAASAPSWTPPQAAQQAPQQQFAPPAGPPSFVPQQAPQIAPQAAPPWSPPQQQVAPPQWTPPQPAPQQAPAPQFVPLTLVPPQQAPQGQPSQTPPWAQKR